HVTCQSIFIGYEPMTPTDCISSDVLFVADNLALDFVNTEYGLGDQHHDCLTDDESVLNWLKMAGQLPEDFDEKAPPGLLALACELRAHARAVIHGAMTGLAPDLTVVNQVLASGHPIREIRWNGE